jgi:hypothetical protein
MSSIFRVGDLVLFGECFYTSDGQIVQPRRRVAVVTGWVGPHYQAAIVEKFGNGINVDRAFAGELTVLAR